MIRVKTKEQNTLESIIHSVVFDVALKAAFTRIISLVPFLGFPVISPVFIFVTTKLASILYEEIALLVQFKLIDFQTESHNNHYQEAVKQLQTQLNFPKEHWPTEKDREVEVEKAKAEFKRTLHDLVYIPH